MWTVVAVAALAAATVLGADKADYSGAQLLRVSAASPQLRDKLSQLEEQEAVEKWYHGEKEVDVFVSANKVPQVKQSLNQSQLEYRVLIENIQDAIDNENPPLSEDELLLVGRKAKRRLWCLACKPYRGHKQCCHVRYSPETMRKTWFHQRTINQMKLPNVVPIIFKGHRMTWQYYHRLDDIHGYLDYLAQTYPDLVSVQNIGTSVEGKPLKLIKISSGEPNSKAIWLDGGTHAREWITPASVTYIINQLVENRDSYLDLVRGVDFHILPVLNPDGYEYSHTVDRLWRKNRGRNINGVCVGTDLNRNWGYKWGGAGSSKVPCKEIYAGARAFSEPETAAVSNYVLANKANMKGYLTFHSYGQYVLYPWGYDRKVPPDYMDLFRVGQAMGDAMYKQGGHQYSVGSSATTLYSAAGGADDWAKGQAGVKYAYTVELPDTGRYGFMLPATYIQPVAKEAFAAVKVMIEEVKRTP